MKTISIKKLNIKNFKGIKKLEIEFKGNVAIYGDNGTGKTSIKDSFHWLLFNKSSLGKSDFQIKPTDKDGNEIHNLETMVEAVILFNESEIILKKIFSEKWTKKRGTATKEFTGHNIDYFLNDVPVKKGEYDFKISEIIDQDLFKLLTDPYEFNNIHWEKRREILLNICGDVSDEYLIKSNKEFAELLFADRSIEDHKKVIEAKKRDINKEIQKIPVRIDEINNSLNELAEFLNVKTDKESVQKQLEETKAELAKIQNNEKVSELKIKINEIDSKIIQARNEFDKNWKDPSKELSEELRILKESLNQIDWEIKDIEKSTNNILNFISSDEKDLEKLRSDWDQKFIEKIKFDENCSACGQSLPENQLEKIISDANRRKAEILEIISEKGKKLKSEIETDRIHLEHNKKILGEIKLSKNNIEKEIEEKQINLSKLPEKPKFEAAELEAEKNKLLEQIENLKKDTFFNIQELNSKIFSFENELKKIRDIELKKESHKKFTERIEELEKEEQKLSREYEELENTLFLIEKFIVKKVESVEVNVNEKFKMARFKMFKQQINGGIEPCCETIYDGIEFNKDLNSSAKINVGLDIIDTISKHYGFKAPIFIDNAESVNKLINIETQLITLHVSLDEKLTVIEA